MRRLDIQFLLYQYEEMGLPWVYKGQRQQPTIVRVHRRIERQRQGQLGAHCRLQPTNRRLVSQSLQRYLQGERSKVGVVCMEELCERVE